MQGSQDTVIQLCHLPGRFWNLDSGCVCPVGASGNFDASCCSLMCPEGACVMRAATTGNTGLQDAASTDAVEMIASAKTEQIECPGTFTMQEGRTMVHSTCPDSAAEKCCVRSESACVIRAASKGETGMHVASLADAAEMIGSGTYPHPAASSYICECLCDACSKQGRDGHPGRSVSKCCRRTCQS